MNKKIKHLLVAVSFFLIVGLGGFWNNIAQVWGYIDPNIFPAVLRSDLVPSDIDWEPVNIDAEKSNVLFLIDVGSAMSFTAKGQLPEWSVLLSANANNAAATRAQLIPMLKEATYGAGGRPGIGYGSSASRAGREVDSSNNAVGSADCYYSTDPSKPYFLTFQDATKANSATLPSYTTADLMPNDSRLYKLKLVFWRLLQENSIFDSLRFAMATTYQDEGIGSMQADFYKVKDWGRQNVTMSTPAPNYNLNDFINGTGPDWVTGIPGSGGYVNSQSIYWGVIRDAYDATQFAVQSREWYTVNRAVLRVPFGENTVDQRRKFVKLIDGVDDTTDDNSAGADFRVKNPELLSDGKTPLANSIFPGIKKSGTISNIRDNFLSQNRIYFSSRTKAEQFNLLYGSYTSYHRFGKGSGEASGTVLDFFSPPIAGKGSTTTATNALNAIRGNFPIRNRCENNWLIVFTAGDDSSSYTSAEAVEDLYNHTRDRDVVLLNGTGDPSDSNLEAVRLYQPIRTMVIGFVDPTDPKTQGLRDRLNKMADAGDDGDPENNSAEAYFANDVPGLITALRNALVKINAKVVNQSNGPVMPVNPQVAEDAPEEEAFSAAQMWQRNDQRQGFFGRFKMTRLPGGKIVMSADWDLGEKLKGYASLYPGQRRLATWNFNSVSGLAPLTTKSNLSLVPFPGLLSTPHALAATMGLEPSKLYDYTTGPHPSNLMLRWLHGWDYRYLLPPMSPDSTPRDTVRKTLLSDTGNSNYVIVGRVLTSALNNQSGYNSWAGSPDIANRARALYVQSNGGMLHALDISLGEPAAKWGREKWAFIPPNVLINQRLAGLKFRFSTPSNNQQVARWIDAPDSTPALMTDGGIRTVNLWNNIGDPTVQGWQTYLFGSLGRGGAGLYSLQITNSTEPQFLWAVENNLYSTSKNSGKGSVHFWGAFPKAYNTLTYNNLAGNLSEPKKDYRRLGFNAPSPAIGTTLLGTKATNIGVLSAGMPYDLDLNDNGKIGSAIYVFNPINGELLREFNSSSTIEGVSGPATGLTARMGMMITPPTLVTRSKKMGYVDRFFTADNRGDIYEGRFIDDSNGTFYPSAASWILTYVASVRNSSEVTAADHFAIPYRLIAAHTANKNLWIFGGTGDVNGRNKGEDPADGTRSDGDPAIVNKSQWLFGFENKSDSGTLFLRQSSLVQELSANASADKVESDTKRGWRIAMQLQPSTHYASLLAREYLSCSMLFVPNELFAATYIPDPRPKGTDCTPPPPNGKSRIYRLEAVTGKSEWPDACATKYLALDGIKVSGLSFTKHADGSSEVFLAVSILDQGRLDASTPGGKAKDGAGNIVQEAEVTKHSDTLLSIKVGPKGSRKLKGERLNYWREVYTR